MAQQTSSTETGTAILTFMALLIALLTIVVLTAIILKFHERVTHFPHEEAVRHDIRRIGEEMLSRKGKTGHLPIFSGVTADPGFSYAVHRESYDVSGFNLYICKSSSEPDASFAVAAQSISGRVFAWKDGKPIQYKGGFDRSSTICPALGYAEPFSFITGFNLIRRVGHVSGSDHRATSEHITTSS